MPLTSVASEKILTNGKVWTGNNAQPWTESVVMSEGRIIALGESNDLIKK